MICDKHYTIHARGKSGTSQVIRCVDPGSVHFTHNVTDEQCKMCPRHVALVEAAKAAEAATRGVPVPNVPSLPYRLMTYTEAVAGWAAAGMPERSKEEVQRIFNEFCSPCDWYDGTRQLCRGCGCKVTQYGQAIVNKIKMATQRCPRGLW